MDYDSLETYYIGRIVGSVIGTVVALIIVSYDAFEFFSLKKLIEAKDRILYYHIIFF